MLISNFKMIFNFFKQSLCQALSSVSEDDKLLRGKEGQFLALSLLFCLAEWVMKLPRSVLLDPPRSALLLVFKVNLKEYG